MGWATIGFLLTNVGALATSVVTARLLAPEVFGLVALVLVIVYGVEIFADGGTMAALIQQGDPIDDAVSTALIALPAGGLVGAVGIAAASPLLAWFYGEPKLTALGIGLSGWIFIYSLSIVPDALLMRRLDLRLRRAVVDPLAILAYGVVVVVLVQLGAREWSLVAGQYASVVVLTAGCWYLARPSFRAGRPSLAEWRRLRRYSRPILLANVVRAGAFDQAPAILLGRFLAVRDVGLWGAGWRLAQVATGGTVGVLGQALFPALSRLQGDVGRLRARALESFRLISLISVPLCVSMMAFGEPFVAALLGEAWRGAGPVLQVLGFWALATVLFHSTTEVLKACGDTRSLARSQIVAAGALLVAFASLLALSWLTLAGVAAAFAIAAVASLVSSTRRLVAALTVAPSRLWHAVRPALVAGVVQGAALAALSRYLVPGADAGSVATLAIVGLLALAGLAVYVAAVEVAERKAMVHLVTTVRLMIRPAAK